MRRTEHPVRRKQQSSYDAFILENSVIRVTVVPELGGKIVSLMRSESNYEYLLQPPEPDRASPEPLYAAKFEDYETSGFDECVPTVAECLYPEEPFLGSVLPDHGDIWSLPTHAEYDGEILRLVTTLRSLPLRFTKAVQIEDNRVRLDYQVTNLSHDCLKFLWCAHPLLRVEPGAELLLPQEVKEVEVGWSADGRLGSAGDRCSWPESVDSSGRKIYLNRITSPDAGTAEKLFTPRLSHGFCGMFLPREQESIAFRFDARLVPYVGVWICQGGWPTSREAKHFTAALEPCLGRPDSLTKAIRRSECATVQRGESMQWWMEIEVNGGPPRVLDSEDD